MGCQADDTAKNDAGSATDQMPVPLARLRLATGVLWSSALVAIIGQQSDMDWTDVWSCSKSGGKADIPSKKRHSIVVICS